LVGLPGCPEDLEAEFVDEFVLFSKLSIEEKCVSGMLKFQYEKSSITYFLMLILLSEFTYLFLAAAAKENAPFQN